jgi:ketosteroid isomerase-like protein
MARSIDTVFVLLGAAVLAAGCASASAQTATQTAVGTSAQEREVAATERAFAKTMADRDFAAFNTFLSNETIFFSPEPLRGKEAVAARWKQFYDKTEAPFSWEPDRVVVLESGNLALSTGPVRDPGGKVFARFSSIWRLEAPGTWRIIFDQGCQVCAECAKN